MNEYEVVIGCETIVTPPLRNEREARTYAIGWYAQCIALFKGVPEVYSVRLLKRGIVPHDLSSGTSEA